MTWRAVGEHGGELVRTDLTLEKICVPVASSPKGHRVEVAVSNQVIKVIPCPCVSGIP